MERTVEEIVTALETIKDVCKEYDNDCCHCPLRVSDSKYARYASCGIHNTYPHSWKPKRPEKWYALDFESYE